MFDLTTLVKADIIQLINEGWKCSEIKYSSLCKWSDADHKDLKRVLVSGPGGVSPSNGIVQNQVMGASVLLNAGETYFPGRGLRGWIRRNIRRHKNAILIPPGKFLFFLTREVVDLPFDVEGSLFMNPKVSNLGLLFFTLGHVDPGFRGRLTATLLNMTDRSIYLDPREPPLRIVFSRTEKPIEPHPTYHYDPQLDLSDTMKNLAISRNPGFALTGKDFATKSDLYAWTGIVLAIVFGLFSLFVVFLRPGH